MNTFIEKDNFGNDVMYKNANVITNNTLNENGFLHIRDVVYP